MEKAPLSISVISPLLTALFISFVVESCKLSDNPVWSVSTVNVFVRWMETSALDALRLLRLLAVAFVNMTARNSVRFPPLALAAVVNGPTMLCSMASFFCSYRAEVWSARSSCQTTLDEKVISKLICAEITLKKNYNKTKLIFYLSTRPCSKS